MKGDKLTPKQALREIKLLRVTFIGDREALHNKIDEIIKQVK